jgi:hypothetical protein
LNKIKNLEFISIGLRQKQQSPIEQNSVDQAFSMNCLSELSLRFANRSCVANLFPVYTFIGVVGRKVEINPLPSLENPNHSNN